MTKTASSQEDTMTHCDTARAADWYEVLRRTRPRTQEDLRNYVQVFLGVQVPDRRICPGHSSPMDYLWHSFAGDHGATGPRPTGNADAVVWANRAGGKTELAAVATLLDALFKPNCQIRILGGSGEQSGRMYEYLTSFFRKGFEGFLAGPVLKGRCRLANGAAVEVLTQSATSVRGTHVQKLRCDEVELFDEDVFAAAKFTTQSTDEIAAAMELISTMHRPYGLMHKEVTAATRAGVPVFKWCIWETIEQCTDRNCSQCSLVGRLPGPSQRCRRLSEDRRLHHADAPQQPGRLGVGDAVPPALAGQRRLRRIRPDAPCPAGRLRPELASVSHARFRLRQSVRVLCGFRSIAKARCG